MMSSLMRFQIIAVLIKRLMINQWLLCLIRIYLKVGAVDEAVVEAVGEAVVEAVGDVKLDKLIMLQIGLRIRMVHPMLVN
jgi:hypothetical protein